MYIHVSIWGFPKIRGTFLGVPIIRTLVFWGPYWGPLILGNYHIYIYVYTVLLILRTLQDTSRLDLYEIIQRLNLHTRLNNYNPL